MTLLSLKRFWRLVPVLIGASLAVAMACGGDDTPSAPVVHTVVVEKQVTQVETVVETVVVEKQVEGQMVKVVETVLVDRPVTRVEKVVETVIVEKEVEGQMVKVVETVVVEKQVTRIEKVVETVVVEKQVTVTDRKGRRDGRNRNREDSRSDPDTERRGHDAEAVEGSSGDNNYRGEHGRDTAWRPGEVHSGLR